MSDNSPERKVVVGAAVGGLIAFVAWLIEAFGNGIKLSADAALGLQAAIVFIVQYMVPNRQYPDDPPTARSPGLVGLFALLVACIVAVSGCANNPPAAVQVVQEGCARDASYSAVRCAKAIGDTYEVYQDSILRIIQDPTVDESIKARLQAVDREMTPVAVAGLRLTREYNTIKQQLAAGETEEERLRIANQNLEAWIVSALPKIAALREALGL